ncbi:hypothetical protein KIN20_018263 [Parelaphostrongylus tenuis]|uniref:Uncharacterized protein n=1 Tax=Parelaphostrongylus tenuis TaxID=148309 RepID=A0AAD5N3F5_PARTN|nr:hypothetical protein KIN20_018263 [Parelaphostrongylus tenuis]
MKLIIEDTDEQVADFAARYVRKRINDYNCGPNRHFVLGLPTVSSDLFSVSSMCQLICPNTSHVSL